MSSKNGNVTQTVDFPGISHPWTHCHGKQAGWLRRSLPGETPQTVTAALIFCAQWLEVEPDIRVETLKFTQDKITQQRFHRFTLLVGTYKYRSATEH